MRIGFMFILVGLASLATLSCARESEDPADLSVEIQAPLDAQNNATTPPTVTVLGLTLPVAASSSSASSRAHGADDPGFVPPAVSTGQLVKVELLSDTPPLTAQSYAVVGAYDQSIKIKAPVQAVNAAGLTVTLLGLTVDISTAVLDGQNDDNSVSIPIAAAGLAVGQNAEITLDPAKLLALVAIKIEVRNFTNQLSLHIEDQHGVEIENETEAIQIEVEQHLSLLDSNGKRIKKTVHLETETHNGALDLSGLSPGRARVTLIRHGKTLHKNVTINANSAAQLKIKVKS